MIDYKELLELAGKALGRRVLFDFQADGFDISTAKVYLDDEFGVIGIPWNPINDDGDALRLANSLFLSIIHTSCMDDAPVVMVGDYMNHEKLEQHAAFPDDNKEVRRAIVRAAAEIGRRTT